MISVSTQVNGPSPSEETNTILNRPTEECFQLWQSQVLYLIFYFHLIKFITYVTYF